MRVVLDSSVLIAAHLSRAGVCADLLEDVLSEHEWITSDFIVDEVCRKLKEKFRFPDPEVAAVREFIKKSAQLVSPAELPAGSCRDPADLPILGTAVAGKAHTLVSVDKDLLDLKSFSELAIIRPGEFFSRSKNLHD